MDGGEMMFIEERLDALYKLLKEKGIPPTTRTLKAYNFGSNIVNLYNKQQKEQSGIQSGGGSLLAKITSLI